MILFKSPKALFAGLLLAIIGAASWAWWRETPAPPRWSDQRPGEGMILALATGNDPTGIETLVAGGYHRSDGSGRDLRIVCFDAAQGKVRWESREDRALPNASKIPALTMDAQGDVLVGWDYWSVGSGRYPVIAKHSGSDGRRIWEWSAVAAGGQSGHLAVPVPDVLGRVWAAGIQQTAGGRYQRFLALLDSRDGAPRWENALNTAQDANDRRATVEPLQGGDAFVVAPPEGGEGNSPWILQRVSGENGRSIWRRDLLRADDRVLPGLHWVIDQGRSQVIVFWGVVRAGKMDARIVTYDLRSGEERWSAPVAIDELLHGMTKAVLTEAGEIVAWSRHVYEVTRYKWWRWRYEEGLWLPEVENTRREQPLRTVFSGRDGSLLRHDLIARADERITAELPHADAKESAAIFLRSMSGKKPLEPWRVGRSAADGTIRPTFVRRPSGLRAALDFPRCAVVTPGGRLAIGNDPAGDQRIWRITVW